MNEFQLVAKTYNGLEQVLASELVNIGANNVEIQRRAVTFTGNKALMYKANLCLRTALRILKPIASFQAKDPDEVYDNVKLIDWEKFMGLKTTFSIDATVNSDQFKHSKFVAYRVKDAIADYFNERYEKRPSVRLSNPDLYINVHISHSTCTISLDSSGESLHKRGYRSSQNEAPISEVLAAGMLLMAGWNGTGNFIDPMCGSGTFLIEAALIAKNIPPCIYRSSFAFEKWNDFDKDLFDDIYNDDSEEREFSGKILGFDINRHTISICTENIRSAGMNKFIEIERRPINEFERPEAEGPWLMVTNPPYGERIISDDLYGLYRDLGSALKHSFSGNQAWVISSHTDCLAAIGMKPSKKVELINGALNCEYWNYEIFDGKRNDFVRERKERK